MFTPTPNTLRDSIWHYQYLARDYEAMTECDPEVVARRSAGRESRFNFKVQTAIRDAEKIDFKRWRQVMDDDYRVYKAELDRKNHPLAIGGRASVMQDELLKLLNAAKKLNTVKSAHTGVKSQKEFSQKQTDAVVLQFSRGYVSASRLMLCDEGYMVSISVPFRCYALVDVEQPFTVAIDFKALHKIVKLADKGGRLDFQYRHLVNRLQMLEGWEGRQRTSFIVNPIVQSMIGGA